MQRRATRARSGASDARPAVAGQQQRAAAAGGPGARTATRPPAPPCRAPPPTAAAAASSTTSGAESASAVSRRSSISPLRATAGQWMRDGGRALAVGAQAVEVQLGRGAVHPAAQRGAATAAVGPRAAAARARPRPPPPPARRAAARAAPVARPRSVTSRTASRSGSWIDERRRARAPAGPGARSARRSAPWPATAAPSGDRLVEQRVAQLAPGRGHQARLQLEPQRVGLLLLDRGRPGNAADPAPRARPAPPTAAEPQREQAERHAGHAQRGGVEQQRRQRRARRRGAAAPAARVTASGPRPAPSQRRHPLERVAHDRGRSSPAASGASSRRWVSTAGASACTSSGSAWSRPVERGQRLGGAEQHQARRAGWRPARRAGRRAWRRARTTM